MAIVTPQSDLVLLKCPLEVDQLNQLTFSNATAQYNYFNGLTKYAVNDFTYQRKDGTVRFPAQIDTIRTYNYCMYRNDAYSNKWFYAFITEMRYANDGVTEIELKTDPWQTWCFDINFKRSFVEREHVSNDTIGAHTIDEGLSTGEPILNSSVDVIFAKADNDYQRIVAQVTTLPEIQGDLSSEYKTRIYNGVSQGCYFVVLTGYDSLLKFCKWYDSNTKKDAIVAMFMVPYSMVSNATLKTAGSGSDSFTLGFLPASYTAKQFNINNVSYSATLNGYTPVNRKLYTFPYSYLNVTNNAGTSAIFRYEDFADPTTTKWNCYGVLSQGCQIKLYPTNDYKGSRLNEYASSYSYGISCGKLPVISWQSDYYLNWQAQNGANNAIQAGLGVFGTAISTVANVSKSQNGIESSVAAVKGGLEVADTIRQAIHEDRVASLVPEQAKGNVNCGDINYTMQKAGFTFQRMSIRAEYARIIDNYFSAYGYRVNEFKTPQISSRRYWNYIKCINVNIIGDIPQEDMDEIKSYFNTGITFWHDPSKYLDYSQNNAIV